MTAVQTAINHMGSATALANYLGVTTQAVCFWRDGKRKIPAEICIQIDKGTGGVVRCEDLRPDVSWDHLRQALPELAQQSTAQGVQHA